MRYGTEISSRLIAFALALAAVVLCISSCAKEHAPVSVEEEEEFHGAEIGFTVSVPSMTPTKAPSGNYDDGRLTDYENYIDIRGEDFCVYFFTIDNKFIQKFEPSIFESDDQASTPNAKFYILRGTLQTSLPSDFKIVLLANWGKYPTLSEGSTISDLSNNIYTFDGPLSLGSKYIPMFGIKTCTNKSFVDGMLTWCDVLHLLRAVAKIEVIENDLSLEEITAVRLNNYNAKGICAPSGVYQETDYVKNSYIPDYVSHLTLFNGNNDSGTKSAALSPCAGSKKWVIYIPEYQNLNSTDGKIVRSDLCFLEVDMQNKIDASQHGTYRVDFKYYSATIANENGADVEDYFNIQRNYDYQFTVTRGTDFQVVAEVLPYSIATLNPIFGMSRDPDGRVVDVHGRLIDYQGHLIQENEDGKLYLSTPLFTLASYIPEIGSLVNDHNEPVDELGRRINYNGWLIDEDGKVVDASGEITSVNGNGYLFNPMGIIDNYGYVLVLPEGTDNLYRSPYDASHQLRCDKWGHLIDNATGTYLVNEEGQKVDIYMRTIVTETYNGVTRDYLVKWNSDGTSYTYVDSKGNNISVDPASGYMLDVHGFRINKNGNNIYTYSNGKTYFVRYFTADEKADSGISDSLFLGIPEGVEPPQYYIAKINKYGDLVDEEYRRINADGQLIDAEGNLLS